MHILSGERWAAQDRRCVRHTQQGNNWRLSSRNSSTACVGHGVAAHMHMCCGLALSLDLPVCWRTAFTQAGVIGDVLPCMQGARL